MGTPTSAHDTGSYLLPYAGLPVQAATLAAAITTGTVINRATAGYPASAALTILGSYTDAGGVSGDLITIAGIVQHADTVSGGALVAPATFQTFSVTVPWVADGTLKEFDLDIPLNLNGVKQFFRLSSLTVSKSGTHTPTAVLVGASFVFGGMPVIPATQYVLAGFVGYSS